MTKKVINLNGLNKEKVMSPEEMKNLKGGSSIGCTLPDDKCILTSVMSIL